jgi:hypothetical protein
MTGAVTRRQLLLGAAGSVTPVSSLAAIPSGRGTDKALWVWLRHPDELPSVVAFALRQNFSPMLVHLRKSVRHALLSGDKRLLTILRTPEISGISMLAVAGEPQWALTSGIPDAIRELLTIQARYRLFAGLHLDVEPHTLPQWRSSDADREALASGFIRLIELIWRERDPALPLQAALHPKACLQPVRGQDLLGLLAPFLDEVSIMAYRSDPVSQLKQSGLVLARLKQLGLAWRLGVLAPKPEAAPGLAYPTEGFALRLEEALQRVRLYPGCRGVAVENARTAQRTLESGWLGGETYSDKYSAGR